MIEPGSCVSMAKPLELFCGIEHQALKKLHDYFIPAGMLTKAGLKKMLYQVNLKGDQDPTEYGCELIRIRFLFIEEGLMIDDSELVDQAMMVLPRPDYADAIIAVYRNTSMPGELTLKDNIQAARDKFEFSIKK